MPQKIARSIPEMFFKYLKNSTSSAGLSEDDYNIISETLLYADPVLSIRLNNKKSVQLDFQELLSGNAEWSSSTKYLSDRPSFTHDPLFHAGAYYVQEASSTFIEVLSPILKSFGQNLLLLDLCAAPGGKSTHLGSIMPEGSMLLCNEVVSSRLGALRENVAKWGNPALSVISRKPSDFNIGECFDLILVDAPCSGEGMFRKDERAITEWSENNIKGCVARQRDIISNIWNSLRPGGILVYSTCTFNTLENDGNVLWIQDRFGAKLFSPISDEQIAAWGIVRTSAGGFQFFPGLVRGEGFFISFFKKDGDLSQRCKGRTNKDFLKLFCGVERPLERLKPPPEYAFSLSYQGEYPSIEISREDAIRYLAKEPLSMPDSPLGLLRITYKGLGLGFVNNIGQRANNLYPKNWRIRNL